MAKRKKKKRLNSMMIAIASEWGVKSGTLDQHSQCSPSYHVFPEALLGPDDAVREGFPGILKGSRVSLRQIAKGKNI